MNVSKNEHLPAALAYIPVIGWIYVFLFANRSDFAMFHLKQSIGLVLFLLAALFSWAAFTWALSWIPFGMLVGVSLFTIVMVSAVVGVVSWFLGISNALFGKVEPLPIFGRTANRLPF